MASSVQIAVTVAIAIALLYLIQHVCKRSHHRLYPPGPPSLPILGNIHQIPVKHQQVKFQEWGRTYGDITYVRMFSTPAIVINSVQVAYDLMEKRGANYSDRPPLTLLNDMMGWDTAVTHFHYNDPRFRKHRKWISDSLQNREVLWGYQHIQYREACNLLLGLIDAPEDFETHIKRFAAAILTEIAYGHKVTGLDDELLAIVDKAATETVKAGSPGSNPIGLLVEFFPICFWTPPDLQTRGALDISHGPLPNPLQMFNWREGQKQGVENMKTRNKFVAQGSFFLAKSKTFLYPACY